MTNSPPNEEEMLGWPAFLIVNGLAGTLSAMPDAAPRLAAALRAAGFDLVHEPDAAASLSAQWDVADASGARIIFVAGGDGTLRDAAARLRRTDRLLAPLPGGTLNRLCVRLGLPMDPLEAAAAYARASPAWLNAGTANGEVFLYQLIIGRSTRLMRFREMQRGAGASGWWPLIQVAFRAVWRATPRELWVRIGPQARQAGQAVVVTLPEPDAEPLLLLHIARHSGPLARLRQAWRWFRGKLGEDAGVAERRVTRVAVHARLDGARMSLDGEMRLTRTPVRVHLHLAALRILRVPPLAPSGLEEGTA
jgi:diacylglycerol kinase family enzyme